MTGKKRATSPGQQQELVADGVAARSMSSQGCRRLAGILPAPESIDVEGRFDDSVGERLRPRLVLLVFSREDPCLI